MTLQNRMGVWVYAMINGLYNRERPGMPGNGRGWPGMPGIGRKWREIAGDGQGWPGMDGDGREWPGMAGNGRGCPGWPMVSGIPVGLHARVLKRGALALRDF